MPTAAVHTIHVLRHSSCSMLARAEVGLVQAQHLMGHSDPRLTAEVDIHLGVQDLRGAVERLERSAPAHTTAASALRGA